MGYTHHWYHTRKFSKADWDTVTEAFGRILDQALKQGIALSASNGDNPMSSHDRINRTWLRDFERGPAIFFNGVAPASCETMVVHKNGPQPRDWHDRSSKGFDFCKTLAYPYDTVVTAFLIFLTSRFPRHIRASSDGELAAWQPGMDLLQKAFGPDGLSYPHSVAFPCQFDATILAGEKFDLCLRHDGALCLVAEPGKILLELPAALNADVIPDYTAAQEEFSKSDYRASRHSADQFLRKIKTSGSVLGWQTPQMQILPR